MSKKETIEEVKPKDIQRIIASTNAQTASIEILQLFTQHQAKTRYSKEDLKSAFFNGGDMKSIEEFNKWFEQFKQ